MGKPKVVITDYVHDELTPERQVLGDQYELQALNAQNEQELRGQIDDAAALMVYHNITLSAETLHCLQQCRVIARVGVGFDNIDGQAARQMGIPICNVPDYGTEEVADSAIGMLLCLTRGLLRYDVNCRHRAGAWDYTSAAPLWRLRRRTLGVVGLGRIGTATAIRAKAFGLSVVFYDPYVADGYDKALGISRVRSLEELMRQSHAVTIHCPLTDETRGMIGSTQLAQMPHGGYLVNTARGPIVDTQAIPSALASGQLAGVALDVLPREPPSNDDPLISIWREHDHPLSDRVMINPHAAFYCEEGRQEMRRKAAESCRRAISGEPLSNVVNL